MRHPEKLWLFQKRDFRYHTRSHQPKKGGSSNFQEVKEKATVQKFDCYHIKENPCYLYLTAGISI